MTSGEQSSMEETSALAYTLKKISRENGNNADESKGDSNSEKGLQENDKQRLFREDIISGNEEGDNEDIRRYDTNNDVSISMSRRNTGASSLILKAQESKKALPKMGGERDYPPPLPDRSLYIVLYDGQDDPIHPFNWGAIKKVECLIISILSALSVSLGSSMFAEGQQEVQQAFHIGREVATLGTTLYVLGFATGPIVWGPFSELYGRKIVMIMSNIGFIAFAFGCATAKDVQTLMLCRFFGGCIGAAPFVVSPAILADLYTGVLRGEFMALFAMVLFGGPMIGPIIGAFATKNQHLGWRWTSYISAFISCLALVLTIFFMPETSHQIILSFKAENLRRRTGNWGIHAAQEELSLSVKEIVEKNIARPLMMLFTEQIILWITIYNAFIYGLLYLLLTAMPLIFQGRYHFRVGVDVLPYISILIGTSLGSLVNVCTEDIISRRLKKTGGTYVAEYRLIPMMIGSVPFCGGLFWLCWAGDFPEHVHWIVPTVGGAFVGFGFLLIFLPCLNYIIDCYLFFAASALAANTFLRSVFGGVFPLFAYQMFVNMKIKYAGTLLGCVAAVLIPVPILFYRYGHIIRKKSSYAN